MSNLVTDLNQLRQPVRHDLSVEHSDVAERVVDAFSRYKGYGLSANQIGIQNSRTCLVSVTEDILFVNPKIVSREGTTHTTEGCLSIPNAEVRTERSIWVEVEADRWMRESVGEWNEIGGRLSFGPDQWNNAQENSGQLKRARGPYLESIAVQHEIDHLNGKTIYEREFQQRPFEKDELDKLGRNDKVYVQNADGEEFDVKWKYAKKKCRNDGPWTLLEINE